MLYMLALTILVVIAGGTMIAKKKRWKMIMSLTCLVALVDITATVIQIYQHSGIDELKEYDTIVVLGSGVTRGKISEEGKNRMDAAIELQKKNQKAVMILSGGGSKKNELSEAQAMEQYLKEQKVTAKYIKESRSRNTFENIKFSSKYINKEDKVAIVTSDYHMYRALQNAKEFGWNALPHSYKTSAEDSFSSYIREVLAIHKMRLQRYWG